MCFSFKSRLIFLKSLILAFKKKLVQHLIFIFLIKTSLDFIKLGGKKMAETKSTTTKKVVTETTNTGSTTKTGGSDQWKDILESTRTSYMASLKSLTKLQEETEKLISNLVQKSKNLQEDNVKVIKDWIENGIKVRDEFKRIFEDNYKKVLSIFEGLNIGDANFPFKGQFDELLKKTEENFKKYFSFIKM